MPRMLVRKLMDEQPISQFDLLKERIELLAERWIDESRRNKEAYEQAQSPTFSRSCYQRYVDYERRAAELRRMVKFLPLYEEWQVERAEAAMKAEAAMEVETKNG